MVEGESTYQLFLDNELVQEYPIRGELLSFHFGAFHDSGASFETFVDNVRVIRRSDIGSNEPVLVVDEIEAQRDLVYLQTQNGPELIEDAGEINFEIFSQQPQFTAAELEVDGITYDLTQDEAPEGDFVLDMDTIVEINELYDIESSSANDWSDYANGKAFNFTLTHDGDAYNYSHFLPGESALPPAPNISINGDATWATDPEEGHEYVKLTPAENSGG